MDRQTLAQEITQYLTEQGAVRVGFADLHGVTGASLPYGITALVALPREIVGPLVDQPHRAYYDAYQAINVRLDAMAEGCAALLRTHGYQATANTEEHLPTGAEDRSPLPHKAVACRAGLGWIGKNNLLTTPDFGGAVRLCTVVTDAPLPTAEPVLSSRCGSCRVCGWWTARLASWRMKRPRLIPRCFTTPSPMSIPVGGYVLEITCCPATRS